MTSGAEVANAHREEALVGTMHRLLELRFGTTRRSAEGKPNRSGAKRDGLQAPRNDQEFVTTDSYHRFLRADLSHEKTTHANEHVVAHLVPVRIVVLLEMVDMHDRDAPVSESRWSTSPR